MKRQEALAELLHCLTAANYHFIAVTPATHARVLSRPAGGEDSLRDIFGWNRPFTGSDANAHVAALLEAAGALETVDGKLRSKVRVASLGDGLFLHGAFPTDGEDAVFFGPDTYRFARFVERELPRLAGARCLVEMGAGTGAAAIRAATLQTFDKVTLVDRNAAALELASVNADVASVAVETLLSDAMPSGADLVIANPPYMIDPARRSYRDGGGLFGGAVALDWVEQAIARLAPGGTMLLYTGVAYVDGEAPLLKTLASICAEAGFSVELGEIDPDVFGEELDQPHYGEVERIAAVGAVIKAPVAAAT